VERWRGFELNTGLCEDTYLRTTTIGDSVFKNNPRLFHSMRPDVMMEAKLRTWRRNYMGGQ